MTYFDHLLPFTVGKHTVEARCESAHGDTIARWNIRVDDTWRSMGLVGDPSDTEDEIRNEALEWVKSHFPDD